MPSNHNSYTEYRRAVKELCNLRKRWEMPCGNCVYFETPYCPEKNTPSPFTEKKSSVIFPVKSRG